MMMPGRSYSAGGGYRYGFNGKENDNEVKGEGSQQDYGMRIYDPRIGRFLSVDPLTKKYPFYTPYQFAGDCPMKFIDLDGLEPAEPGTKKGEYQVAKKEGTEEFYGYTWSFIKGRRRNFGFWKQGGATMYQNGNIATTSSNDDNTKIFHSDVRVISITAPSYGGAGVSMPARNMDDDLDARYKGFANAFTLGTKLENDASQAEAQSLLSRFVKGVGGTLSFGSISNMATLLGKDPAFVNLAQAFEQQALLYYKSKGSLEGFENAKVLEKLGMPQIKDTWFMHTVMGGTQQWNAQITQISAGQVKVRYMVWDRFGAGTDDAQSSLPGLPSLYWLQHNSAKYYPSVSKNYNPFIWNIQVNR